MFVYNFDSGVNFCGKKFLRVLFLAGTFFADREKLYQQFTLLSGVTDTCTCM